MKVVCGLFTLLFIVYVCSSCEKSQLDIKTEYDYQAFNELLSNANDEGLFIENIKQRKNGTIEILFSNNQHLIIRGDEIQFITIGLNGMWYRNDSCTSYLTEEQTIYDVLEPPHENPGDLYAISEDYEDWTFHFVECPSIIIRKVIYSKDFDSVILSINHRGHSALAPENTLPAFRLSRLKGFRYAEADVRFTADNVPVLLHDESINRTSNGVGKIKELTFSQVRQYDFGSWKSNDFKETKIPSLDEFLILCKNTGLHPVLELKVGTKDQINQVMSKVEELGLGDETIYISFSSTILSCVLENKPLATVAFITSKIDENTFKTIHSLKAVKPVIIDANDYKEESIVRCREQNIPLWVWVINSEETILSLSSYISAVTSDNIHAGRLKSGYK